MGFDPFSQTNLKPIAVRILRHHSTAVYLLMALIANLAIAPMVLASTGGAIERSTAYSIGLLGIVVVGLAGYLFVVIFQPERF